MLKKICRKCGKERNYTTGFLMAIIVFLLTWGIGSGFTNLTFGVASLIPALGAFFVCSEQ